MKCLSEDKLQEYFDRECSEQDRMAIELHLEECPECKSLYKIFSSEATMVKDHISMLNPQVIPEISIPKSKSVRLRRLWPLIPSSAAAVLLLISLLLNQKLNNEQSDNYEQTMHEFYQDKDPNRLLKEPQNSMILDIETGNLIIPG